MKLDPVWLEAKNLVKGFKEFIPNLKRGEIIINNDGTYEFSNFGIGFVIMPSGLGYFQNGTTIIPAYSPLIFSVDMMTINVTDHDNDNVLTINEDVDGDRAVSYTHLRAHETRHDLVCRLLLEKKKR